MINTDQLRHDRLMIRLSIDHLRQAAIAMPTRHPDTRAILVDMGQMMERLRIYEDNLETAIFMRMIDQAGDEK